MKDSHKEPPRGAFWEFLYMSLPLEYLSSARMYLNVVFNVEAFPRAVGTGKENHSMIFPIPDHV